MSPEIYAIIAVGLALAGLILRGQHGLGKRIDDVNGRLDEVNNSLSKRIDEVNSSLSKRIEEVNSSLIKRIDEVNSSLSKRMDGFDERLRALETGQAELKGLVLGKLDFIERYIIARNLQASEASPEPGGADE